MADWNNPTNASTYTNYTTQLKDRDLDLAKGLDPANVTVTNPVANMVRWNSANSRWEKYDGAAWNALVSFYAINISGSAGSVAFANVSGKPTTLAGYGISDAQPLDGDLTAIAALATTGLIRRTGADSWTAGTQVSGGEIADGAVTYTKIQTISATDRLLGRATAGAGVVEEIVCTAFARSLLDDASASTARSTLGISTGTVWTSDNDGSTSGLDADTVDGLEVHTGVNNVANRIVRTDGSGYLQAGYISSGLGNEGNNSNPSRVWGTNGSDAFFRSYLTSALQVAYAANAGNAGTVTNGVYTTGSYSDPAWITSLSGAKVTNAVLTTGSYGDPAWITSLSGSKISGGISGNAGSVTNGVYTTGSYSDPAWITALAGSKISGNISGQAGNTMLFMSTSHNGTYWLVNNWDSTYWHITSNHPAGVRVARADSAGTADSANGVAWTNVSGRPTAVSAFTNDSGYITSSGTAYNISQYTINQSVGTGDSPVFAGLTVGGYAHGTNGWGNRWLQTYAPSNEGSNGDVWYVY